MTGNIHILNRNTMVEYKAWRLSAQVSPSIVGIKVKEAERKSQSPIHAQNELLAIPFLDTKINPIKRMRFAKKGVVFSGCRAFPISNNI